MGSDAIVFGADATPVNDWTRFFSPLYLLPLPSNIPSLRQLIGNIRPAAGRRGWSDDKPSLGPITIILDRGANINLFSNASLLQDVRCDPRLEFITEITYLPTQNMVSDYLTKPLLGSISRKHRDCILGITELEEAQAQKLYASRINARTSA